MKSLVKIVACIVIVTFILPVVAFAVSWPAKREDGLDMPFRPSDKYVTDQNPPDFRWQYVDGAKSYELIVSKSEDLSSPVYIAKDLTCNYYNFDCTFETGVNYWWGVRFTDANGSVSDFSTPRRFRIAPEAMDFAVPSVGELMDRIPASHPRILMTPDTLDEIRSYSELSDYSKKAFDGLINSANNYVNRLNSGSLTLAEPNYEPPVTDDEAAIEQYEQNYRSKIQTTTNIAKNLAFAYIMSKDGENRKAEYATWGKQAVMAALKISMKQSGNSWIMDSTHPASYPGTTDGQSFREITYKCAEAYDWLYDVFSPDERAIVQELLRVRTPKMLGVITNVEKVPYQPHGWTVLGFLGIICVATYGDIPEAEQWLTQILPLYTNMLPPWGYEDGGWSQGVDYWQWSSATNQEFMNVLALGGIINLYGKAWAYKEHLWSLYVYPYGSYGSFGDGSGINKAGVSSFKNIANTAYFTKNPVAHWILESYDYDFTTNIDSYYAGMVVNDAIEAPVDYPLGHEFDDVGWAVMTDSLTDADRVQLTFKSSPFGSYNHVAAEQNSFFLQAYGQILAGKSGYYDSYHSPHHATISKATFAHNSITVDGAKGQGNYNFNAKGDVTQFITHLDFDSVTGDASDAYVGTNIIPENLTPSSAEGKIDKFIRNIIYIRPGVFVVVDDLDAYGDEKSSFEWWLNSPANIDYTSNTAYVENGIARMNVNVHYPAKISSTYYKGFVNPIDGKTYNAGGSYATKLQHNRVCFATESLKETKMVTTMSVYKEGEDAVGVVSHVLDSCLKLIFEDGTVCLVNLGDNTKEVSDGTVSFKGTAVTYNSNSIMLTNGTSLYYNGSSLVNSANPITIAIGRGQISMSITDEGSNANNNAVTLKNNNEFISIDTIDELKDKSGRSPSLETGFYSSRVSSSLIRLYPYKGNYTLYAEGDYVKPSKLVVENATITKGNDKYYVRWKEVDGVTYDISVNGNVYKDVESPYPLNTSSEEGFYRISVRGRASGFEGQWSDELYLSSNIKNTYSYVRYFTTDNTVTAEVFAPNFSKEPLLFILESYNGTTGEYERVLLTENKGIYSGSASLNSSEKSHVKTFLWEGDNFTPVAPVAYINSSNTNLKGIYADGVAIDGYSNLKDEYSIEITGYAFPAIEAIACDNSAKVTVTDYYGKMYSLVKVVSSSGSERNIKINYVYPQENIHFVSGAATPDDFKDDTARSKDSSGNYTGKISNSTVGTLKWNIVYNSLTGTENAVVKKTAGINVYTNVSPNKGGTAFGSRVTSDRGTTTFNYSEYNNVCKEYWGYDYIVFPNQNFIDNITPKDGYSVHHIEDATVNFTLEEPCEVVVLSCYELKELERQNFEREVLAEQTNGRYMTKKPDPEDVYYNIVLNGAPVTDLTKYTVSSSGKVDYEYLTDYDKAMSWINVEPLKGYTTIDDYINSGLGKSSFVENGTLATLESKWYYVYPYAYVRSYDNITGPTEISIDFGDFEGLASRMIIVLRPIGAKKPISNFKYVGPLKFEELSSNEKLGCTDNYSSKRQYGAYKRLPIMRTFEEGAIAYVDNDTYTISNINPLLGLEGASFVPPHRYLNIDSSEDNWMKAYYYGLTSCEGLSYPGFSTTPKELYSFDLNRSASLYVITYGNTPEFIDSTWQRFNLKEPAFTLGDATYKYTDVYVKNIDVPIGESVKVTMKTPASGSSEDGVYFLLIK